MDPGNYNELDALDSIAASAAAALGATILAAQISDSTAFGRLLLTAPSVVAQRNFLEIGDGSGLTGEIWLAMDRTVPGAGTGTKNDPLDVSTRALHDAAVNAALVLGKVIRYGAGVFLTSGLTLPAGSNVIGAGIGQTILRLDPTSVVPPASLALMGGFYNADGGIYIDGFTFDGNRAAFVSASPSAALVAVHAVYIYGSNNTIRNWYSLNVGGSTASGNEGFGCAIHTYFDGAAWADAYCNLIEDFRADSPHGDYGSAAVITNQDSTCQNVGTIRRGFVKDYTNTGTLSSATGLNSGLVEDITTLNCRNASYSEGSRNATFRRIRSIAGTEFGIQLNPAGTQGVSDILIDDCDFNISDGNAVGGTHVGVQMQDAANGTNIIRRVTINNCRFSKFSAGATITVYGINTNSAALGQGIVLTGKNTFLNSLTNILPSDVVSLNAASGANSDITGLTMTTGGVGAILIKQYPESTNYNLISLNGATGAGRLGPIGRSGDASMYNNVPTGGIHYFQVQETLIASISAAGTTIGSGGTAVAKSAVFTSAMSQSIGTLAQYEHSITAAGVVAGDVAILDIPSQPTGIIYAGHRTTTDEILVKFYNTTGGSLSLTGTIRARSFEV